MHLGFRCIVLNKRILFLKLMLGYRRIANSKIDVHNKHCNSLSCVRSEDLDVAIVAACLITSRHRHSARLPYRKRAFQILKLG